MRLVTARRSARPPPVEYLRELINGAVVVVPLAVDDISAGQMVVVQSMGLGKPVVVTDTPTIRDYVTDGYNARLVPMGDAEAMAAVIGDLLSSPAERKRLGANARATFDAKLSTEGAFRALLNAIGVPSSQSAACEDIEAVSRLNK
jgi:glycosyltransferase involved in cell wall biosynthesis